MINAPAGTGEVTIDQCAGAFAPGATAEAAGTSEIELQILHKGADPELRIIGTPGNDTIRIGAFGAAALNADADVDLTTDFRPRARLRVRGSDTPAPGADFVTGRPAPGADTISTDDGLGGDAISGGEGDDRATSELSSGQELRDIPDTYVRTESIAFTGAAGSGGPIGQVGRLSLHAPRSVRAGGAARVGLRWTAPRTWRTLGAIDVRLHDGGAAVGRARIAPRRGTVTGAGLLRRASGAERHGRAVRARLAWRLPRGLAGHDLRVAVEAVRRDGARQSAPSAGLLHVR